MSDHIYFAGDPEQDSARRHLERVLAGRQRRRWPFLAALFAGGTAFTVWRMRKGHREGKPESRASTSPEPDE